MEWARRILDDELDELFNQVPAIAIDGAKGVGKTTTAEQRVAGVVRLDSKSVRESIAAEPEQVLGRGRPLLIDEWQKAPEVWDVVRRAVDANPAGGQFLLAGSATPVPGATAHSGAGRIGRLRMRPMTLSERGVSEPTVSLGGLLAGGRRSLAGSCLLTLSDYVEEIVASGFPAMRLLVGRSRRFQLDSYLHNAVDRDVPEQGLAVRKPAAMLKWLRAYAAATATTASYAQILDAATPGQPDKPARSTSISYRDVLTWLVVVGPGAGVGAVGELVDPAGSDPEASSGRPGARRPALGPESGRLVGWGRYLGGSPIRQRAGASVRVVGDVVCAGAGAGGGSHGRSPADPQRRPRG